MNSGRELTSIEKKYVQDEMVILLQDASKLMAKVIGWHLLSLNENELKTYLQQMMVERDFLSIGALYGDNEQTQAEEYINLQKKIAQLRNRNADSTEEKNKLNAELIRKIDCFPKDNSWHKSFLCRIVYYADAAGPFNALKDSQSNYGTLFSNFYGIVYPDMKKHTRQLVDIRNKYKGHDSDAVVDLMNWQEINLYFMSINYVISIGKKKNMSELFDAELEKRIKRFKDQCHQEPRKIEDDKVHNLCSSVYFKRYDEPKRTLYMFPESEYSENILKLLDSFKADSDGLKREENGRLVDNSIVGVKATPEKAKTEAKHQKKPIIYHGSLTSFADLSNFNINQERLVELCSKSYVLADTSFLMAKDGLEYISNTLIPLLETYNNKLLIEWATRAELFGIENNIKDNISNEDREVAHNARTAMHHFHELGYVVYLDNHDDCMNSMTSILSLIRNNANRHFWVLTKNNLFVESCIAHNCKNVITSRMVNRKCKVHVQGKILMQWSSEPLEIKSVQEKVNNSRENTIVENETLVGKKERCIPKNNESISKESRLSIIQQESLNNQAIGALIPNESDTVFRARALTEVLGKRIGGGGEGDVYEIVGNPDMVAKIYNKNHCDRQRFDKLNYMVDNNPRIKELCWPEEIICNENGDFIGFTMKRVPDEFEEIGLNILMLSKPTIRDGKMRGWNRLNLVQTCGKIASIFSRMHSMGILMGDVNARNFMLNYSTGEILLVDCDSFQIGEYCCPVGTIEFTSPKIYERLGKRSINFSDNNVMRELSDDEFAMAVLLFKILMLNQSPYTAKGTADLTEAICNYRFGYRDTGLKNSNTNSTVRNTGADTPDGPYRLIWNNTFYEIKQYFVQTFTGCGTVKADIWQSAFKRYSDAISKSFYTDELLPVLYLGSEADYPYYNCEMCGQGRNMHIERMERKKRFGDLLLCKDCESIFISWEKSKLEEVECCSQCGKQYNELRTVAAKNKLRNRSLICYSCKEEVNCTCAFCNRVFRIPKYKVKENVKLNRQPVCPDCLEKTEVKCSVCGCMFETPRFKVKKYQQLKCPNCINIR